MTHIIVTGNPVDGFEFFGPFNDEETAIAFCNTDPLLEGDWWVAPLHPIWDTPCPDGSRVQTGLKGGNAQ